MIVPSVHTQARSLRPVSWLYLRLFWLHFLYSTTTLKKQKHKLTAGPPLCLVQSLSLRQFDYNLCCFNCFTNTQLWLVIEPGCLAILFLICIHRLSVFILKAPDSLTSRRERRSLLISRTRLLSLPLSLCLKVACKTNKLYKLHDIHLSKISYSWMHVLTYFYS